MTPRDFSHSPSRAPSVTPIDLAGDRDWLELAGPFIGGSLEDPNTPFSQDKSHAGCAVNKAHGSASSSCQESLPGMCTFPESPTVDNGPVWRRNRFNSERRVLSRLAKRSRKIMRQLPVMVGKALGGVANGQPLDITLPRRTFYLMRHECVVCQSSIIGPHIRVTCGHYYDVECLLGLVEAATRDESLFPPRCCQQRIRDQSFVRYMSPELAGKFNEKAAEFSTVRRVYCANPSCSRFLGARTMGHDPPAFGCPSCATRTCSRCRIRVLSSSGKHRCSHDPSQRQVLALADEKGWTRCPACEQMIELRSGCYHITCVCAEQFCYLCRAPWKTCACPQWEQMQVRLADIGALDVRHVLEGPRMSRRRRDVRTVGRSHLEGSDRSSQRLSVLGKDSCVDSGSSSAFGPRHCFKISRQRDDIEYICFRGRLAQRARNSSRRAGT